MDDPVRLVIWHPGDAAPFAPLSIIKGKNQRAWSVSKTRMYTWNTLHILYRIVLAMRLQYCKNYKYSSSNYCDDYYNSYLVYTWRKIRCWYTNVGMSQFFRLCMWSCVIKRTMEVGLRSSDGKPTSNLFSKGSSWWLFSYTENVLQRRVSHYRENCELRERCV